MSFFDKIKGGFGLAYNLRDVIFSAISSPLQSAKITKLVCDIKSQWKDGKITSQNITNSLDLLVKFRDENRDEYDRIAKILDDILDAYKKDKESVKENLDKLIKN